MSFGKLASIQITQFNTPTVVYTAPTGGAVAGVSISNLQGIPLFFSLSIGTNNPAVAADFLTVKKIALPNISGQNTPFLIEKMPLSAGEMIIVTMLPPDDSTDYLDTNTFALNVRVFGADQSDLTTARYTY
jgi:hypothetical protein